MEQVNVIISRERYERLECIEKGVKEQAVNNVVFYSREEYADYYGSRISHTVSFSENAAAKLVMQALEQERKDRVAREKYLTEQIDGYIKEVKVLRAKKRWWHF